MLVEAFIVIGVFDEGAGTPILGHFLCSISLYLKNYAVVGIYKINFDCSENNLNFNYTIIIIGLVING